MSDGMAMSESRLSPIQTLLQGAGRALDLNWNLRPFSGEKDGNLRGRAEAWLDRALSAGPGAPNLATCGDDVI
jgi:hypothetical protein